MSRWKDVSIVNDSIYLRHGAVNLDHVAAIEPEPLDRYPFLRNSFGVKALSKLQLAGGAEIIVTTSCKELLRDETAA